MEPITDPRVRAAALEILEVIDPTEQDTARTVRIVLVNEAAIGDHRQAIRYAGVALGLLIRIAQEHPEIQPTLDAYRHTISALEEMDK